MHFAQKNVLAALFVAGTLLAFFQPQAQANSTAVQNSLNPQEAKANVTAESCSLSDYPLTKLSTYIPAPKIVSYNESSAVVIDMRTTKQPEVTNKAKYASAKVLEVSTSSATTEPAAQELIEAEFKVEEARPEGYELNADVLLSLINDYRVQIGVQPLAKDESLMQIARERTSELFDEIFVNGNMHAGFYARNLPYYATENIIYNQSEQGAFNWWLNSAIHRAAIQNGSYTHTGIACSGKSCSQIFTHFQAK